MFSHEGDSRSDAQNCMIAGYLAVVAGFVNSSGFLLVGTFTSHVTGNVGRLANDAASGRTGASASAASMVLAFFFGSFLVSVMLESRWSGHVSRAYASALASEALMLSLFAFSSYVVSSDRPRILDGEAALLCTAMGMQNALVTRLSGAVVRTTHLTGVVTDLGIESARWFRYLRGSLAGVTRLPFVMGPNAPSRPSVLKTRLLGTIALGFLAGGTLGALGTIRLGRLALMMPVTAILLCALYALRNGRLHQGNEAPQSRS